MATRSFGSYDRSTNTVYSSGGGLTAYWTSGPRAGQATGATEVFLGNISLTTRVSGNTVYYTAVANVGCTSNNYNNENAPSRSVYLRVKGERGVASSGWLVQESIELGETYSYNYPDGTAHYEFSGSVKANSSTGRFSLTITMPGAQGRYDSDSDSWWGIEYRLGNSDEVTIEETFSGAEPYYAPNGSITIPAAIVAGQNVPVAVTMSGSGSLTGTLKRFYKAASASIFTATTIKSNITGSNNTVTDTIPSTYGGGKVYYELTVSNGSESKKILSATKDIVTNSAPSVPSSLTVPSTIGGGQNVTISWGSSTDPDGNLSGYLLEHSVDGGATWQTVYKGPDLSASETVIAGTQTIRWRVRAYDTYDVYSGEKTSSELNVINNNAPTVPASPITITPAALSTGGTAVISWGESTDPDGDDFEYSLERSVGNTVSYTEIYRGKNRYFSDTIGSWSAVTYRVRAIDARGAKSDYRTASTKSVSSNTLPAITCSNADGADLGAKSAVFSFTYSVDDENESDTLTVTESIDGVVKKSFTATRDTSYTFNFKTTANADYWQSILNGEHSITISVTDGKATVSRSFTFLKNVGACLITLKAPISAAAGKKIGTAVVSICGEIPAGGITAVQVCSDGDQDSPTWESCILASSDTGYAESGIGSRKKTANSGNNLNEELIGGHYLFIHKLTNAGSKFNFRVQVSQAGGEGGWIGSVQGTFTEESAS